MDTITIPDCIVDIFSRVGNPKEIGIDRGTQCRTDFTSEGHRLLLSQPLLYHCCYNGGVKRLYEALKLVINKLFSDHH